MKKIVKNILVISVVCALQSGCTENLGYTEDIKIRNKTGNYDTVIRIDEKYTLKDYKKECTADGCTVTVYYELDDE